MKQKFLLFLFIGIGYITKDAIAQRNNNSSYNMENRYDQKNNRVRDNKHWDRTRENNKGNDRYKDERREYRCRPMGDDAFFDAVRTIKNINFDDSKLEIANSLTALNCLTTDQILSITQIFSFEANRLEYAKNAYTSCADPQNYFRILSAFTFNSSKEALNKRINAQQ